MKYYLINNKIMKASSEMPKIMHPTNFHYDTWIHNIQPCKIRDSELDKVINHYIQEYSATSNPIDVTDIVNDNDGVITFKQPSKSNETNETVAIDRLVGWFRKRVSIKDYEVDYLKFVMNQK